MADDRCKPHQGSSPRSRSKRRESRYVSHKRGLNTKIHLAADAHDMPVRVLIVKGTRADCKEAVHLIVGMLAEILLVDKGYDTNEVIEYATSADIAVVEA